MVVAPGHARPRAGAALAPAADWLPSLFGTTPENGIARYARDVDRQAAAIVAARLKANSASVAGVTGIRRESDERAIGAP